MLKGVMRQGFSEEKDHCVQKGCALHKQLRPRAQPALYLCHDTGQPRNENRSLGLIFLNLFWKYLIHRCEEHIDVTTQVSASALEK